MALMGLPPQPTLLESLGPTTGKTTAPIGLRFPSPGFSLAAILKPSNFLGINLYTEIFNVS